MLATSAYSLSGARGVYPLKKGRIPLLQGMERKRSRTEVILPVFPSPQRDARAGNCMLWRNGLRSGFVAVMTMALNERQKSGMRHHQRTMFRQKVWETYRRKQERTVLPRFVTPRVFVCCWLLFAFLLSAVGLAWWVEVPVSVVGSGILLEQPLASHPASHEAVTLIFLPTSHALSIQRGASIQFQGDKAGSEGSGLVERVEPGLTSPQDARRRYSLNGTVALLVTRPSIVVWVRVTSPLSEHLSGESIVSAHVPIGTERLLTLLFSSST